MFMAPAVNDGQRASMKALTDANLPFEQLTGREARARYPQVNFEGLDSIILEQQAGYLSSRLACQSVANTFVRLGGRYRTTSAAPGPIRDRRLTAVTLADGSALEADAFVFACGPWMGKLFPAEIGALIQPARQMGLFFGLPAGAEALQEHRLPVWIEAGAYYGIPGNDFRGFKIVGGTLGETADPANPWDPDRGERVVPAERVRAPREYLARRFPALANAPLLDAFVCQDRELARRASHRRSASGMRQRLVRRWRFRPWLQAQPGPRGDGGEPGRGQGRSEPAVRSRPAGSPTVEGVTLERSKLGLSYQRAGAAIFSI